MVKNIPDDVKATLGQLSGPQQVVLRKYIASLRAEIKDLETEIQSMKDPDPPMAHYHGDHRCTADHGHSGSDHHKEGGGNSHSGHSHDSHHDHKQEEHSHGHGHDHKEHKDHDHKDHDHGHKDHNAEHSHGHGHKEHSAEHNDHSHKDEDSHSHGHKDAHAHDDHSSTHEHSSHSHHDHHKHIHDAEKTDDMPAWKKKALESGSDPTAAPFGSTWDTEASLSAKDKMEE